MSYDDETAPDGERSFSIAEDGPAGQPGRTVFDPSPYMRQLRGRGGNQDYLDVKWRLLWLRREHPDAEILTEHVRIDEGMAIFKATVSVPTGGKATGYGSETAGDFGDFIEKAETKAIGRALNALGYGAQFSDKGDEDGGPPPPDRRTPPPTPDRGNAAGRYQADARPTAPPAAPRPMQPSAPNGPNHEATSIPHADRTKAAASEPAANTAPTTPSAPRSMAPTRELRDAQPSPTGVAARPQAVEPATQTAQSAAATRSEPVPIRPTEPMSGPTPRPVATPERTAAVNRPERASRQPDAGSGVKAAPSPQAAAAPTSDDDDIDMADMTWTAFWEWARPLGYRGRGEIERLLGYAIDAMTPADVRAQVRAARGED